MGSKRLWLAQHKSPIIHNQYVEAVDIENVLRALSVLRDRVVE